MVHVPGGISILDLEHFHCRAITGVGPDGMARYCGDQKEERIRASGKSSYCHAHGEVYFQRIIQR
jgi:hypothetical protein